MTFQPGDVVQLKSGSSLMTVEKVGKKHMTEEEAVWCIWSEQVGKRQEIMRETFPPIVLEKHEPFVGAIAF